MFTLRTTLISISFCGCYEKYIPDTSRHKLSQYAMLQEKEIICTSPGSLWKGNQPGNTTVSFGAELWFLMCVRIILNWSELRYSFRSTWETKHVSISPSCVSLPIFLEEQWVAQPVLCSLYPSTQCHRAQVKLSNIPSSTLTAQWPYCHTNPLLL